MSAEVPAVHLIVGDAIPLMQEALAQAEKVAGEVIGLPAFNRTVYRASEPAALELAATARTLPMMADRRLVVLKELENASDGVMEAVVEYLQHPSDTTVLILAGAGFPKVRKGGKNWSARVTNLVKKLGKVDKYSVKSIQPRRFAQDVAAKQGNPLGRDAADVLVELVGSDLARLQQEIVKVGVYVGDGQPITASAVHECCSQLAEAVVWDLTTGLATRDADLALASMHRLQSEGDDARKLLGLIVWQYRKLLELSELARRGASEAELRKAARMRPDVFGKVKGRLGRGFPGAAKVLDTLVVANRQMNSHRAGADRILEDLVFRLLRM